jgi:hypothetical protein
MRGSGHKETAPDFVGSGNFWFVLAFKGLKVLALLFM